MIVADSEERPYIYFPYSIILPRFPATECAVGQQNVWILFSSHPLSESCIFKSNWRVEVPPAAAYCWLAHTAMDGLKVFLLHPSGRSGGQREVLNSVWTTDCPLTYLNGFRSYNICMWHLIKPKSCYCLVTVTAADYLKVKNTIIRDLIFKKLFFRSCFFSQNTLGILPFGWS